MSDSARFDVTLEDGVSRPAKTAAQALDDLRQGIDRNQKELASMNSAMRDMKKAGDTTSVGFKSLEKQIADKTKTIGAMRSKYVELGGSFRKVKPPTKELSAFQKVAEGVPGPIGQIAARLGGMGKFLVGGLVAAGVFALGAALVGLAAAAITAGAALVTYGIQQADARRSEALRLEGLTRLRRGMHEAGGSATEMQAAIDRVSDSSSASRSTLEAYAERLHRLGLRGGNFTAALEGMTMRGEVLGDRYAQSFAGMAAAAARSGRSVRELANTVSARLGDIAGKKLIALDVTMRKLRENFDSLFRNVKIEGFLKLFREFASVFSQARVTGRALAGIMERLFEPLDRGAEDSVGSVRRFFTIAVTRVIQMENGLTRLRILWLQTWQTINTLGVTTTDTFDAMRGAVSLWGEALVLPFTLAALAVKGLSQFIESAFDRGAGRAGAFRDMWRSINLGQIASDLIAGLVVGIVRGTASVITAVETLADATVGALREALEIKSPSRVFADLGKQIPAGLSVGVRAGEDAARASVANMIDASIGDMSVSASGGAAAVPSSHTSVVVEQLIVQSAATDAPGIAVDIRAALTEILEGVSLMRGGAPA